MKVHGFWGEIEKQEGFLESFLDNVTVQGEGAERGHFLARKVQKQGRDWLTMIQGTHAASPKDHLSQLHHDASTALQL